MFSKMLFATIVCALSGMPVLAQNTHAGGITIFDSNISNADLYVEGPSVLDDKVCIGNSCVLTETFATDTLLKLNGPVTGIEFQDSASSTYPGNDWRLLVNESSLLASGGMNRFSVEDLSAGTIPFTIEAGTPDNALWISNFGNIGIGTSIPTANLHIVGNIVKPNIQMDSIGVGAQSWQFIGGNTLRFHDNTNNQTPLQIEKTAPDNSLFVEATGNIGIGTDDPATALHVVRSDGTAALLIEETGAGILGQLTLRNNGTTFFTLEDTSRADTNFNGRAWNFQNQNGTFRVTTKPGPGGGGAIEMVLEPGGDMTIGGDLFTNGSVCAAGCDRVFDADYPLPTMAEQAAMMRTTGHLPNVGPTDEQGRFNVTQKVGGMLNELEKAHLYIAQLHDQAANREARILRLEALVEGLGARQSPASRK
ncbi:hypothetical protein [Puniceibacterium sp. IMCC21224]|uniref:hypothetical protein n=1 Tax=Puniceibacterium sp. IMCC21224 TaxID=1618204 RepID=UPI00065D88C6|nr:hypothetical protein [Puniceibacterium sp. IMCC21224]KMK63995.1 hypothetical protein IMCC21224_1653 [Puniceibacterium sp. IMCC21224]